MAVKDIGKLKDEIQKLKDENNKKVNVLVRVHLKEIEDLKMDNIALEENVESLKEALEESNAKTAELKLVNTAVEAKIQIFMKKHIEIEGKKKLVREYQ